MRYAQRPTLLLLFLVTLVTPAASHGLDARIVNGNLSFADPTVGALLFGSATDQAMLYCSGTLVGCSTFVTAGHCVCSLDGAACQSGASAPDPGEYHVFFQHAGFVPVQSISVPPGYDFPSDDVAIVRLAAPVTGITPSPLVSLEPAFGSDGTIVGYGLSTGSANDYGLKQRGHVTTAACAGDLPPDLVCWDFEGPLGPPGTNSNTCNGDSGGPLFADEGGAASLAGITSGGSSFDCMPTDNSYDTSVAAQLPFIDAQAGSDLGTASCGSLSQVGDAATQVVGFTQRLDSGKSQGTHSVDVGPGVAELRVALNASEEIGADVDLYVRFGTPPTTTEFDCRAYGSNQWGFCSYAAPAEGTYYILVKRYSGASTYQVTATLFAGEGSPPPPPPVADKQRRPQRRCLNALAEAGAQVARAQAIDAGACLHAFARGRTDRLGRGAQARTAEACLSNDVNGDVARALARTLERDAERCQARPEQLPDFAYRGGGPVNGAARGQTAALAEDLFGADLDLVLASKDVAPGSASCQEAVIEASGDVLDAGARLAVRAKRNALRGAKGNAVESAAQLELALLDAFARDPHGRLTHARSQLQSQLAGRCTGIESPLATLFPGVCSAASGVGDLADCADRAALCRLCQAQNAMDGLALDCDLFDDGVPDLTCP